MKSKKQLSKLYVIEEDDNLKLLVKTPDGVERIVDIFSGSGYYEAIWLRTPEEIEESKIAYEKADREWRENFKKRQKIKEKSKWWQFWKQD